MAIKKQEFYEGAAIHLLAKAGNISSIRYESPFFVFNDGILVLLKYSTKGRSPWGFTFTPAEQDLLHKNSFPLKLVIAFVCGAGGVAALNYDSFVKVAAPRSSAIHFSCYRSH